jgi:hypothetical protein
MVSDHFSVVHRRKNDRRVGGGVAPTASHRSGRAQLTHPAPPAQFRCLATRAPRHTLTIRSCFVDTVPRVDAPAAFPPSGLCPDVPLPLDGLPTGAVRPLPWYYGDTPTSVAHLAGSLRSPSNTNAAPWPSLPPVQDALPEGLVSLGSAPPGRIKGWRWRLQTSQVPGEPPCWFAWVLDPGKTDTPGPLRRADAASACVNNGGSRRGNVSGLDSQAFQRTVYASPRQSPADDARLVSRLRASSTGWDSLTHWVPTKGLQDVIVTSLLPSQASPGAMTPFIRTADPTAARATTAALAPVSVHVVALGRTPCQS